MALFSPLYNLPNHALEKQKMYQSSTKPIMMRGPRSGLYVGTFGVLFSVGMVATTYAIYNIVAGNKSEE
ncbi:hypothetical protein D9619_000703 [Psilocybe cf. subviscida]|uniref:Uncharacterized protein n=1 Tax=Psilocybe cf. subviscida TaxID=2480587 RepID=A0A8H5BE91_9AGAR|nr:hypothetical protein D9619_000703 [Psilocybe cf. subviscida]